MAGLISANEISGASVYGIRQYDYTVDRVKGQDYAAALTAAAFRESAAIEQSAAGMQVAVRKRMDKVNAIGEALAAVAKALQTLDTDSQESSDRTDPDPLLGEAQLKLSAYGISLPVSGNQMTRGDAMKAQADLKYALDTEDNNLQQDIVALQGYLTKRDNAYSTASKIVRKADNAASSTIGNI